MYEILITPFLKIVEMLLGGRERFNTLKTHDKERVAVYLERVAACLESNATAAAAGTFNDAARYELRIYGKEIPPLVQQALGEAIVAELQEAFWTSSSESTIVDLASDGSESEIRMLGKYK